MKCIITSHAGRSIHTELAHTHNGFCTFRCRVTSPGLAVGGSTEPVTASSSGRNKAWRSEDVMERIIPLNVY